MRKKIPTWLFLVVALLWQASDGRAQNIVTNGGFETGNFFGWSTNVDDDSGQIIGPAAHSGSFGADFSETIFEGDSGSVDEMTQTLSTQAGASYILSFWADGVQRSSMGANWNGESLLTNSIFYYPYFSALTPGWTNFQFVVQATGSSTVLRFDFKCDPGQPGFTSLTYLDDVGVLPVTGYNQMQATVLNGGRVQLAFVGLPGVGYALDHTFNLLPIPQWTPLSTNVMGSTGTLLITNTPIINTNNFWRIRVVQ
jgi:hypothetical protein